MPTKKAKHKNGLEFYGKAPNIRWRVYKNGLVVDASSEGFTRLRGAVGNYMIGLIPADVKKAIEAYKQRK